MSRKTVPRDPADLQQKFMNKLDQLERSVDAFDSGHLDEAERIAAALRVLLSDRGGKSILTQLGRRNAVFLDSSLPPDPTNMFPEALLTRCLLTPTSSRYVAPLDDEGEPERWVQFDDWWNGIAFVGSIVLQSGPTPLPRTRLSRKDMVLAVGNTDGGHHVAPLEKLYAEVSRKNALRFLAGYDGNVVQMGGIAEATIRQIGHEVLKSLRSGYAKRLPPQEDAVLITRFAARLQTPDGRSIEAPITPTT